MSEFETLLNAMLNGEKVDIVPQTRLEQYLKNCCDKCGCDGLPTPTTRAEVLLYQLAEQLKNGGGSGGAQEQSGIIGKSWESLIDEGHININNGVLTTDYDASEDVNFSGYDICGHLIIPDNAGVTAIGDYAFKYCVLRGIKIPEGVTQIGEEAFLSTHIWEIEIPDGVKTIAPSAFEFCNSLGCVTIPNSIECIEYHAFAECYQLCTIMFNGTVAEWNKIDIASSAFDSVATTEVTCTDGTVSLV